MLNPRVLTSPINSRSLGYEHEDQHQRQHDAVGYPRQDAIYTSGSPAWQHAGAEHQQRTPVEDRRLVEFRRAPTRSPALHTAYAVEIGRIDAANAALNKPAANSSMLANERRSAWAASAAVPMT